MKVIFISNVVLWFIITFQVSQVKANKNHVCIFPDNLNRIPTINCSEVKVCNIQYHADLITDAQPYISLFDIKKDIMSRCCGSCPASNLTVAYLNTIPVFSRYYLYHRNQVKQLDFVWPVIGTESTYTLHGYYFLPIVKSPGWFHVTEFYGERAVDRALISILNLYPLLLICLLISIIVGFLIWMIET